MSLPAALDHLRDPRVRDLAALLAGATQRRRAAIDPADIPWALRHVWLCDYLPEERDFRYRLAGEAINEAHGRSVARVRLSDLLPAAAFPPVLARYLRVVDEPAIGHGLGAVYLNIDRPVPGERIVLPLASDGARTDMILGMTVYDTGSTHPGHLSPNGALQLTFTPLAAL
ncbi:PAS domain-containing protein [Arenibaculum pallidiluteum]|uniref:PAS domain-containing protein n=1 Tax=Arenibaculum pallidiluteum TaxID=2812559 RepID=UPI001A961886|nr:PAS domain-containing protein [Arenibaculum pallidiluteum]